MRLRELILACLFASILACSPPPAPTQPPFTGIWTGPLPVSATEQRTFAIALHERDDLKLIGHLLAGTSRRTLLGALRSGDTALLVFELKDLPATITLTGTISGDTLTGTAMFGASSVPVVWTRRSDPLEVRSFVFVDPEHGDEMSELAVLQDAGGALVSGNFTGPRCAFLACGGAVTALSETPVGALTASIVTDGACAGAGAIAATFDAATHFYSGTWTHTDAGGCGSLATEGALMGARDMGTRSTDAAAVLASLGQLADDLEDGASFSAPYAPVSNAYVHFGETAAAFLAARTAEAAAHPNANVEFYSISTLRTVAPAGHNALLSATPMVTFSDTRSDASGTYRSVAAGTPGQMGYSYVAEDGGAWRLSGNQTGEFELPFAYTIGADRLIVPTGTPGQELHLSLGGWGAHFAPQTGHLEGNAKVDMMAQYAGSASAMTELANGAGGAPGACDIALVWSGAGEVCGVLGGPTGDLIRARRFSYRTPSPGIVTEILYEERPRSAAAPLTHYFDNPPHWSVRIAFQGELTIRFVHLAQLTGAVRAGLIAATGIDPDTYAPSSVAGAADYCPPSPERCAVNVLGDAAFAIAAHDQFAFAQTDAAPIAGHPGYYRAQLGPSIPPWSQVEFFVEEQVANRRASSCVYQYLPTSTQSAFAALMTADMLNLHSLRYATNAFVRPWKFRAEAELCNNDGFLFHSESDFSSLHAQLGGWFERAAPGIASNEQFTIARIHSGAAAYDAGLYDVAPGTAAPSLYLVARQRTDGLGFSWTAPGMAAVAEFYPTGEVLELTDTGMLIKWRELGAGGATLYQRAAYQLDAGGLKIRWGDFSTTLADASAPVLAAGDACNETTTLCYTHSRP